jgi:general secretion pathway protein N
MTAVRWPSRGWTAFAVLFFVLAASLFMPLRLAAGMSVPDTNALSAKSVYGTIWSGGVRDLKIGAFALGDADVRLKFLPLLTGRAEFIAASQQSQQPQPGLLGSVSGISGTIGKGWGSVSAEGISGNAGYAGQNGSVPLSGIEFNNLSVRFTSGVCRSASGSVRLLLKSSALPGINTDGGFLGRVKCSAGKLLLPMTSQSAMERAELAIGADGGYLLTVTLQNSEPAAGNYALLAGFQPVAGGYRRSYRGHL